MSALTARPTWAAEKWTRAYKANPGFTVEYPAGWTVGKQGNDILVQSPDKASLVVVAPFAAARGASAKTQVAKFVSSHGALLPKARLDKVSLQGSKGAVAVGAVSYSNTRGKAGPGQARVLCLVTAQRGMVYAMAAPSKRFAADKPTLLHVLKSLRFGPPPGAQKTSGATGKSTRMRFVKWTDPKEHAFSVEVPAGWKVLGGLNRLASTHVNMSVTLLSPDEKMVVRYGDPSLPLLQDPNPELMQMYGVGEGQAFNPNGTFVNMFLPYMPAADFGPWYLKTMLGEMLDNLTVTKQDDLSQSPMARMVLQNMQQAGGDLWNQIEVSATATEFKAVTKDEQQPLVGVIAVVVHHVSSQTGGMWGAPVVIISACSADKEVEQHQMVLRAVIERINSSWRENPQWSQAETQRRNAGTAMVAGAAHSQFESALAATKERSAQIAADGEAARNNLMSSYWNRVGASDENQRKFLNYITDSTDVAGGGFKSHVAAGYNSYYLDPRTHTVVGTNSALPQIDLTLMNQF